MFLIFGRKLSLGSVPNYSFRVGPGRLLFRVWYYKFISDRVLYHKHISFTYSEIPQSSSIQITRRQITRAKTAPLKKAVTLWNVSVFSLLVLTHVYCVYYKEAIWGSILGEPQLLGHSHA